MRKLTLGVLCVFLLVGPALWPGTVYCAEEFHLKFATVAPEGSTWMKYMRALDKTLREKSKGKLGFRLYAGGVAGDELDVLRKIRIGQIHCAAFSGVGFGQILPMVRVLDLPFLFRSLREVDLVHQDLETHFADRFREKGFELLAWAEVGNIHLFSKHPIQRVEDLARLKVWTWSGDPISKETFSAMGANPVPLAITDVTTALNTGMVDTVYAPPLGAIALQWHANLKYMTLLPLAHSTGAVLLSVDHFRKMPPELGKLLKEEFPRAVAPLTSELRTQTEEAMKVLERAGVKLLPSPSESDLKAFYKVHDQVAKKLAEDVYPKELLDRVYKILKR